MTGRPMGDAPKRGLGTGGLPVMRPDQRMLGHPSGAGPAPQSTVFIGRFVIIFGPSAGLFVYVGKPGPGNPPICSITEASTDPYGNTVKSLATFGDLAGAHIRIDNGAMMFLADTGGVTRIVIDPDNQIVGFYPAGFAAGNLSLAIASAAGTDAAGNTFPAGLSTSGLPVLIYSGTPALGNLIASVAPSTGTDSYGNAYRAGVTSYSGANLITQVDSGQVFLGNPNIAGGALGQLLDTGGSGGLTELFSSTQSGADVAGQLLVYSALRSPVSVPLVEVNDTMLQVNGYPAQPVSVLKVIGNFAAPTQSVFLIETDFAGDNALGIEVNGDTSTRLRIDTAGPSNRIRIQAGPGNATQDTKLYNSAAAAWASDPIAFNNAGAAETEQAFSFNATNGWTATAGRSACQYWRAAGVGASGVGVWVGGAVTVPAGFAFNQAVTNAAAAAYQPVHSQTIFGWDTTQNPRTIQAFQWTAGGVLNFTGNTTTSAVGDNIDIPPQLVYLHN